MTADEWAPEYRRLVRAFARVYSGEQSDALFEALADLPTSAVRDGVTAQIRESKHWPMPADLRERAVAVLRAKPMPRSWCSHCDGSGFVVASVRDRARILEDTVQNIYQAANRRRQSLDWADAQAQAETYWAGRPLPVIETLARCSCRVGGV